jgi:tripartite-type tricarboxylate transporter receptor subunit TctC
MTMRNSMRRRACLAGMAALLTAGVAATAQPAAAADKYPSKPVRVIVGFAPGGPTDVVARLLSQKLSENLGQQFVVENRVGAGSNIAMGLVAKAAPDGYTVLVVSSALVVNPSLYGKNITYDVFKDFAPVTYAATSPNVVLVNPTIIPAKSMKELIDFLRANPGKYGIGTSGIGTTPDLAAELFRMTYKIESVRVPFNGAAPSLQSTLQGQTPIAFSAMPPATEMVKAGQLRALALTAAHRSPALPDVPTMAEAGIPNQESDTLQGVLVPAGTPREVVTLLRNEIVKAEADPTIKKRLEELGFEPVANTPEQFTAQIKDEVAKWGKVIKDANIKVE